jgi:rare lipoprotein A
MSVTARRCLVVAAIAPLVSGCALLGMGPDRTATAPVVGDPAPIVSGTMRPYQIRGRWYHPQEDPNYEEVGLASWYGDRFHGRPTATGETFDMNALTAAHKTLPLPGLVEVTNLENGRTVVLRVNDRGPFVDGRIIDLSRGAARELGLLERGVGRVRVRYLGRAPRLGRERAALEGGFEVMARVVDAAGDGASF